jgi:hypothetical protein
VEGPALPDPDPEIERAQELRAKRGAELAPEFVAVALERLARMGLSPRLADQAQTVFPFRAEGVIHVRPR